MAEKKFVTGALLQNKEGNRAYLQYSYAAAFGGNNSNDIAVAWIDENGKVTNSSAWHRKGEFEVLDSDIKHNLNEIRKYNRRQGGAPIFMRAKLAIKLGFTSIHTYESARAGRKHGFIKI
jgi:hypothetical protein